METINWDLTEIKRLLRMRIIRTNFIMLLLFFLIWYIYSKGNPYFFVGLVSVVLWIIVAITLYSLITGKYIGTKTGKILHDFMKDRFGSKRWKRSKIIELLIIFILGVLITVLFFSIDFSYERSFSIINMIPFIGAWVGYNIGEQIRMNKL